MIEHVLTKPPSRAPVLCRRVGRGTTRVRALVVLLPGVEALWALPRPTRLATRPQLPRTSTDLQDFFRWRDPDSNRGHHDFQSLRPGRFGPRNHWKTRVLRDTAPAADVRSLRAFPRDSGDGTPLVPYLPGVTSTRRKVSDRARCFSRSRRARSVLFCSSASTMRSCSWRISEGTLRSGSSSHMRR
jgi:hypothetical protein